MMALAISPISSSAWPAIGAPLANHLWQSTVFAGMAGLLTLVLRKNRADARYWLWFVASVKFLIPFSLLVAAGSQLARLKSAPVVQPGFPFVMQQIGQPFSPARASEAAASAVGTAFAMAGRLLPIVLPALWFCGCAAVLIAWWLRWRRVAATIRDAAPVTSGREFAALQRLEQTEPSAAQVRLLISDSTLEPGIAGIFRPVMLLPAGISDRLTDAQLEAIIAHELCHVRRRDNLAAVVHMLVEAIFWFHPLIWWIGTRLIDERERACDEEVLRLGSEPQAYAEGILKVCKFYLESPLVCMSGVTGSNLKKRMEAIMIHKREGKLGWGRKLLLVVMGAAAVIGPVALGLMNPASSRAQSQPTAGSPGSAAVSIQPSAPGGNTIFVQRTEHANEPSEFKTTGMPLAALVANAYDVFDIQVSGGPTWAYTDRYDVSVKDTAGAQLMTDLQNALADRFRLVVHRETNQLPSYDLVVGSGGTKMTEVPAASVSPAKSRIFFAPPGHMMATQMNMSTLARVLTQQLGSVVADKTGLTGTYDFTLDWNMPPPRPEDLEKGLHEPSPESISSLLAAVPAQLGLNLVPQKGPVEMIVIDRAEKPN